MGTHNVTRDLLALDHDVRQVPPVYAKPFRQAARVAIGRKPGAKAERN